MDISKYAIPFIPTHEGLLPKWMLLVAVISVGNTIQAFNGIEVTRKLYNEKSGQVTPLSSRTFGIWTLTSSIVRFYAAYHINEKPLYDMAMWTFFFAFSHFLSELLIFKTAKPGGPSTAPFVVASVSLTWMVLQYDFYLQK